MNVALIIFGRYATRLAKFLLSQGYLVYLAIQNSQEIEQFHSRVLIRPYNDNAQFDYILQEIKRLDRQNFEIYNLADDTIVRLVHSIGLLDMNPKLFHLSTPEMFGKIQEVPQNEYTRFVPNTFYGVSKVFEHQYVQNCRLHYNMFASTGIVYNHGFGEGMNIVKQIRKVLGGEQDILTVNNLTTSYDWCHPDDCVRAMWMILQAREPDDWIVSSGELHNVEEIIEKTFEKAGVRLLWNDKVGYDANTGTELVQVLNDEPYDGYEQIQGNNSKIMLELAWEPIHSFDDVIEVLFSSVK